MANAQPEKLYMHLSAAELAAIIMKDSPNSNDRDAGFCSASSESEGGDDLVGEHARSGSPDIGPKGTEDASDPSSSSSSNSKPIALIRNKRKSTEPSKVVGSLPGPSALSTASMHATGPLKKRIRYTSSADSAVVLTPPAVDSPPPSGCLPPSLRLDHENMPNPAHIFVRHPGVTTLHRPFATHPEQLEQLEPLALVTRKNQSGADSEAKAESYPKLPQGKPQTPKKALQKKAAKVLPASSSSLLDDEEACKVHVGLGSDVSMPRPHQNQHHHQRNYKNMTRERRIEANARERTRVHTISAAYETLRQAVPSYASSQKLSKLSVLRVACSYILTLSRMAGEDYSADQSEPSIADCLEAVTATIQTEGKVKRKKDE